MLSQHEKYYPSTLRPGMRFDDMDQEPVQPPVDDVEMKPLVDSIVPPPSSSFSSTSDMEMKPLANSIAPLSSSSSSSSSSSNDAQNTANKRKREDQEDSENSQKKHKANEDKDSCDSQDAEMSDAEEENRMRQYFQELATACTSEKRLTSENQIELQRIQEVVTWLSDYDKKHNNKNGKSSLFDRRDDRIHLTLLMHAATRNQIEIIKILIRAGVSPDLVDDEGNSVLIFAVRDKIECKYSTRQGSMSSKDSYALVKILIECKAQLDLRNKNGETALMFACLATRYRNTGERELIIMELIKAGASPFSVDNDGYTALMLAYSENVMLELIRCVITQKSPHEARDFLNLAAEHSRCALTLACNNSWERAVEALLNAGANPDGIYNKNYIYEKNDDMSPLMRAIFEENIVSLLLQHGAAVDKQRADGKTALMLALLEAPDYEDEDNQNFSSPIVEKLLEAKADFNLVDNNEELTALCFALLYKQHESAEMLIRAGADVAMTASRLKKYELKKNGREGMELLDMMWTSKAPISLTHLLLERGARVSNPDRFADYCMSQNQRSALVKFSLLAVKDVNQKVERHYDRLDYLTEMFSITNALLRDATPTSFHVTALLNLIRSYDSDPLDRLPEHRYELLGYEENDEENGQMTDERVVTHNTELTPLDIEKYAERFEYYPIINPFDPENIWSNSYRM